MKWRSAEAGAAFPVCACASLRTKVHFAVTPVLKHTGKWGMSCIRVIAGGVVGWGVGGGGVIKAVGPGVALPTSLHGPRV